MPLSLIVNEDAANREGLVADFLKGGIAPMREFAKGDASIIVSFRSVKKSASGVRPFDDTWTDADTIYIGIGNGTAVPVCLATLATEFDAASVSVSEVQAASSTANEIRKISFTTATYGGLYTLSATVNGSTHSCGSLSPIASAQQVVNALCNHPQLNKNNVSVWMVGADYYIEFNGNLSSTAPTLAVTNVNLLAPVGVSGTFDINTSGIVTLFAATTANQITLEFGVTRERAATSEVLFQENVIIHRSVVDPTTAVPTPSIGLDAYIAARAVLYDRVQNLSGAQKLRARGNIGTSPTTTAASFVQPAVNDAVSVTLTDGSWVFGMEYLAIEGAGTYQVTSITGNPNIMNLTLLDAITSEGDTVSAGSKVAPSGNPSGGGSGDVVGPSSATDNAIARFDSTTGKLIQNSGITIPDGASGTLNGTNSGDTITLTNTLFVAKNGSDANAGTLNAPFLTLGAAKTAAGSGTMIQVFPGAYTVTTSILKDGVNWYFEAGASVTKTHAAATRGTATLDISGIGSGVTVFESGQGTASLEIVVGAGTPSSTANAIAYISLSDTAVEIRSAITTALATGTGTSPGGTTGDAGTVQDNISLSGSTITSALYGTASVISIVSDTAGLSISSVVSGTQDTVGILDDVSGSLSYSVDGNGVFIDDVTASILGGACVAVRSGSVAKIACDRCAILGARNGSKVVDQIDGALDFKAILVNGTMYDSTSTFYGLWWTNGSGQLEVSRVNAPVCVLADVNDTPTGQWEVRAFELDATGFYDVYNATVWSSGTNTDAALWVNAVVYLCAPSTAGSVYLSGASKIYIKGGKLYGHIFTLGPKLYVDLDKWVPTIASSGDTSARLFLEMTSGEVRIHVQHVDDLGITGRIAFNQSGGTLDLRVDDYVAGAGGGRFTLSGGTAYIQGRVDSTANTGFDTITTTGATLYLQNSNIISYSGKLDIRNTSGTVTVTNCTGSGTNGALRVNGTVTYTTTQNPTTGLRSATTTVDVSAATAPSAGQVLKAISSTAATWQAESGGVTSITGTANEITVTGTTTPTLSLPSALTFTGKTVTGGTYSALTFVDGAGSLILERDIASALSLSSDGSTLRSFVGSSFLAADTNTAAVSGVRGTFNKDRIAWVTAAGSGTLQTPTFTGSRVWTMTDATGTVPLLESAQTWSGANTISTNGAASTPALKLSGTPYTAGSATTNFPLFYLNDSTATASTTLATTGTMFGVNAHGTPDLMNLMLDGVSKVKVTSAGNTTIAGTLNCTGTATLGGNITLNAGVINANAAIMGLGSATGTVKFFNSGDGSKIGFAVDVSNNAYAYLAASGVSTSACALTATGSGTDITIQLIPKGTGGVVVGTGGTAISSSKTFTKTDSTSIAAGTVYSMDITATGIVAGDTTSNLEMTAIQPDQIVIKSIRCGTDKITVDWYNADLLAAHSLTGATFKIRSFKA